MLIIRDLPSGRAARDDVTRGDGPADIAFAAGPGIRRLISGELDPDRAITTGVVHVLRGHRDLVDRFTKIFHLAA